MERARLKYEYREWLSVIVGKMHTPVNYWNDVYHHGRLWFPVIDRPRSFGTSVPIHTLGLRLQGQNIGKLRFGYDLVIGNGMSSNDVTDGSRPEVGDGRRPHQAGKADAGQPQLLQRHHLRQHGRRPFRACRRQPLHHGTRSGTTRSTSTTTCTASASTATRAKWEVLFEGTFNRTGFSRGQRPRSRRRASHRTVRQHHDVPLRRSQDGQAGTALCFADRCRFRGAATSTSNPTTSLKFGLGWQHEFSPLVKSQIQVERYTGRDGFEIPADDKWETEVPRSLLHAMKRLILLTTLLPLGLCPGGAHRQRHRSTDVDRKPDQVCV